MDIIEHASSRELVPALASAFLDVLVAAQADGRIPHVVLTGGGIANELYSELACLGPESDVNWAEVIWWWGDERFVPADSEERNALAAHRQLIDHLPVAPERVHEMPAKEAGQNLDDAAADYADELRQDGPAEFDLVLLGMGPDGHCASLFPHHPALLAAASSTVAVRDAPKPPPERISLTFRTLNRAARVWFLVSGEAKAPAVSALLAPEGTAAATLQETPARGVSGRVETVLWADAEALGQGSSPG